MTTYCLDGNCGYAACVYRRQSEKDKQAGLSGTFTITPPPPLSVSPATDDVTDAEMRSWALDSAARWSSAQMPESKQRKIVLDRAESFYRWIKTGETYPE